MAFNPINTQEELDTIIQQRLERERKTIETKYADYEALQKKIEDLTTQLTEAKQKRTDAEQRSAEAVKQVADLQNAVKAAELETLKGNIAAETGIPFALRGRLQGTTEEEIRQDAAMLSDLIEKGKPARPAPPAPKLNEGVESSDPLMAMVKNMNFGG